MKAITLDSSDRKVICQDVVNLCLQSGSCDINARDNANYTPLHECCTRGHLRVARTLLENGADVNASATGGIR